MFDAVMSDSGTIGLGDVLAERYLLERELALGALGAVYVARDQVTATEVAVKVLHAEHLANDAMRRRLHREGAALKALDHPAVVRLLEFGVDDDGLVFLVTEYVEGETLAERVARAPLSLDDADRLVEALGGAISAAHAHGILHGDLKPANVLWGERLRLLDFSASKILGLDRLTATGEISGTPTYMAPEVFTRKHEVDERIDVYGLGVLLYEALSGAPPFREGHVGRLLMKIDAGDYLPLDAVAEVSAPVAAVVSRAMHRSPSERHPSVIALVEAWRSARGS
jgi:serine/threonine-protein kinase